MEKEVDLQISSNDVGSTSDADDQNEIEFGFGETSNHTKKDRQPPLYEAQINLEQFGNTDENNSDDDDERIQEWNSDQTELFLTENIKSSTNVTLDISELTRKSTATYKKSEAIEERLKIKNIRYKAIDVKANCFNLYLDLKLEEFKDVPIENHKKYSDDEIKNLLLS